MLIVSAAALLIACNSGEAPLLTAREPAVNVLLLTVDTLRADHLGAYGYDRATSPHIDALAARGILFSRAYSPRGLTFPALATILTSQYPFSHGVLTMPKTALADSHQTLAEVLRGAGYWTAGFNAHLALTPKTGFSQGFHDYFLFHSKEEDRMVERAGRWLEHHRDQPFFVWFHLFGPHSPYQPPVQFSERFTRSDYKGPYDGSQDQLYEIGRREELSDQDREHILALYDGKVAQEDDRVGRLLAYVEKLGLRDRTLVVFSADHGEELFDHHYHFSHEWSVYEGVLRVPLILSLPGKLPEGRVVSSLVESIDLAPTILDAVGVAPASSMQGRSVLPLIAESGEDGRDRVYGSMDYFGHSVMTVRTPRWRYVYNPDDYRPVQHVRFAREELYDLEADPAERTNVVAVHSEVASALRNDLLEWRRWTEERATPALPLDDPELEAQVLALGYVIGEETGDGPEDIARLLQVLTDPNELERRRAALDALVEHGSAGVPALIEALEDSEEQVRWLAAQGLSRIGPVGREAVPALEVALADPDPTVRWQAARALGEIGGPEAQRALGAALEDHEETVRNIARQAYERAAREAP